MKIGELRRWNWLGYKHDVQAFTIIKIIDTSVFCKLEDGTKETYTTKQVNENTHIIKSK